MGNDQTLTRWLLPEWSAQRNPTARDIAIAAHGHGVAYTLDNIGDIYLIGRIALDVVNAEEIDRVLGQVLEAANNDFNTLLELGFASSIRKEWAWRVLRGESLKNLKAFEHLIDDDPAP